MVTFIDDNTIYAEVNETITIPYLVPSNVRHVSVTRCPYLLADYDIKTDQLTVYHNVDETRIEVTNATYDLTSAYIDLEINTIGVFTITIGGYTSETRIDFIIHVMPDLTDLSMIFYEITDNEQLARMLDGKNYTFEANMTVNGTDESKYKDYLKNYRIAIFNSELDTTSQATIISDLIEKGEFSDQPQELNVPAQLKTDFVYDEDFPVIVIITGDYAEGYPNEFTVNFDSLKIYESTFNDVGMQCHHITPISNCVTDNSNSSITLDEFTNSNSFILSRFHKLEDDLDEDEDISYGNNQSEAVAGIAVKLDVLETDNVTLLATLRNDKTGIGQNSIILTPIEDSETPTEIIIGDVDDTWGFNAGDIENLEDWELTLQILNNTSNENSITFNNVRVEYYTTEFQYNAFDYFIEDNNLGYYGVFMQDCDIPHGLNTEIKQLEIEGSDINTISRQNLREKIITLEFDIYDCDPTASMKLLDKLSALIYNERDAKTNQPIPKTFSTSLRPGKEWEYVCTKEIETEFDAGEIHAKVELYVPDGTYKTVDEIITGPIGYNKGLNKVQPEITIGNFSNDEITLTEANTNQKFIIRDLVYVKGDIITLDCANRTIIKSNPNSEDEVDLSNNCDMDNDWFTINKEYNFSSINCNIMKVTYYERG